MVAPAKVPAKPTAKRAAPAPAKAAQTTPSNTDHVVSSA